MNTFLFFQYSFKDKYKETFKISIYKENKIYFALSSVTTAVFNAVLHAYLLDLMGHALNIGKVRKLQIS